MFPWGLFPFNEGIKKMVEQMNPNEIHEYVNEMMKNLGSLSGENRQEPPINHTSEKNPNFNINVFETFDYVYIRIQLPAETKLESLKIFHTSNQAIIQNLIENGKQEIITLPCLVKKKGAIAQVKDEILEIKIQKNNDLQFTEIAISEKL